MREVSKSQREFRLLRQRQVSPRYASWRIDPRARAAHSLTQVIRSPRRLRIPRALAISGRWRSIILAMDDG